MLLQREGLAIRTEAHTNRVPRSQRGGEVIEPLVRTTRGATILLNFILISKNLIQIPIKIAYVHYKRVPKRNSELTAGVYRTDAQLLDSLCLHPPSRLAYYCQCTFRPLPAFQWLRFYCQRSPSP